MDNVIVALIAPPRLPERNLLTKLGLSCDGWSCVLVDSDGNKQDNIDTNTIFVLINQEQDAVDIYTKLDSVRDSGGKAIVYTHRSPTTSGPYTFKQIDKDEIELHLQDSLLGCEYFSHEPDKLYLRFMEQYGKKEWNENKKLLDFLVGSYTVQKVHSLRSIILTPLVGIDLLTQIGKADDSLMSAIKAEMETDEYKNALGEMKRVFSTWDPGFLALIEAMIKKKEVKHVEFKKAADRLEQAINALEAKECENLVKMRTHE